MTDPGKAVFLSYASQDAEAALQLCKALRAAGVEVWFDRSELRGGDAWDQKIRQQIRNCALFVPMISAHTQARPEGASSSERTPGLFIFSAGEIIQIANWSRSQLL